MNNEDWKSVWKKFNNQDEILKDIGNHLMKLHQKIQNLEEKIEREKYIR